MLHHHGTHKARHRRDQLDVNTLKEMTWAELDAIKKAIEDIDIKTAEVLKTKTGPRGPPGARGN